MAYQDQLPSTADRSLASMAFQQPFSPSAIMARTERISSEAARSSREPSAAASEYDRKAKEQQQKLETIRARKQSLIEQQAAIDEEEKLAEESLRSYSSQADSERQQYAAVVQTYDETVADKQEQFRLQLAKEVDLRIVRSLLGGDEVTLDAIKAIAEGRHSLDEMESFKARFADSLAGSDPGYFSYRAAQVLLRYSDAIVDKQAIEAVKDSKICFSVTQSTYKVSNTLTAVRSVSQVAKPSDITAQVQKDSDSSDDGESEVTSELKHSERRHRSPTATAESPAEQAEQLIEPETVTIKKEEGLNDGEVNNKDKRGRRLSMMQIDEETVPSRDRGTSTTGFTGFKDDDGSTETPVAQEKEEVIHMAQSKRPDSLSRKRKNSQVDEDTDDETSQVSEPAKVQKKRKTAAKVPIAGSTPKALAKFTEHIEDLMKAGRLVEEDFQCSYRKCQYKGARIDNPRVASKCQHLYCATCMRGLREEQGTSGKTKELAKTRCERAGCNMMTGAMSILTDKDVLRIRADHQADLYADESETESEDTEQSAAEKTDEEADSSDEEDSFARK